MAEKFEKKAKKNANKKPNFIQKIGKFFHDYKIESKKIVWPTIKTTFKNFWVVLSTVFTLSLFVGALDYGLTLLLKLVMEIA